VEQDGRTDYNKKCFVLTDKRSEKKREVLCIMPEGLRKGENIETLKNDWIKDIIQFRDQC
jgi:hypothetical protein